MNWREIRSPKLATRENPKLETHNPKLKTVHRPVLAKRKPLPYSRNWSIEIEPSGAMDR
jgi:hypothetical protein